VTQPTYDIPVNDLVPGDTITVLAVEEFHFAAFQPDGDEAKVAFAERLRDALFAEGIATELVGVAVQYDTSDWISATDYKYTAILRVLAVDVPVPPGEDINKAGVWAIAALATALAALLLSSAVTILAVEVDPSDLPRIAQAGARTAEEAGRTARTLTLGAVALGFLYFFGNALARRL